MDVAAWRNTKRLLLVFVAIAAVGCVSPCNSVVADVSPSAWQEPVDVVVSNADTVSQRKLHIVVRSNGNFSGDTLTLRIATLSPDSLRYEEAFMLLIPRTPKAASLRHEADVAYRTGVVLADSGDYRFTFTPTRPIRGIEAIGIHIVR